MNNPEIEVSEIRRLVELVETYGLEELTVTQDDLSVTVKGRSARPHPAPAAACAGARDFQSQMEVSTLQRPASEPSEHRPEIEGNIHDIVAPLVGVFYRAPAPDAPAFVEVGDQVEPGAEVGLIEAMKVFSPIPSEVAGEVVEIPAENGKLVQEGDVLVRVRVHEE